MNSPVEILLSTYNGEKYLAAQLDSIIQQNYPHWKLLVRDDGSSDKTVLILDSYIQKYPDKITLLNDNDGNIGYSNSFSKLLRQSSADYVRTIIGILIKYQLCYLLCWKKKENGIEQPILFFQICRWQTQN